MVATSAPMSSFKRPSSRPSNFNSKRPTSKDSEKQALWVPMLENASKGKDLAEKQLLILGGTPEQQKEFLEQLNPDTPRPRYGNERRHNKKAPISNRYALGYTYHDVLDADQEDVLARLNVYMLSNPSAAFAPLLKPLLTTKTVKETLITILLDWSDPFKWARQLRQWVRLLRSVIVTLDEETKIAMEENMNAWKEKRVGPDAHGSQPQTQTAEQKQVQASAPLGPGEWDEGLGIPLSVVCIQSEKIETLEQDLGWQDEQFDFLAQWLRTVLLKHGASLIYVASFDANNVRTLLHSTLSIQSLLKRETAKPNYIERDKTLIPPNWDSWGKIRPLREGTELEAISDAWSVEIQQKPEQSLDSSSPSDSQQQRQQAESEDPSSAVSLYEASLPPPPPPPTQTTFDPNTEPPVTVPSVQEFLGSQQMVLEQSKAEDEKAAKKGKASTGQATPPVTMDETGVRGEGSRKMAEHIGPYSINVNGIDLDAEEATRRLREREQERSQAEKVGAPAERAGRTGTGSGANTPGKRAEGDGKQSNEAMSAFFANLIKKDKRGGSGAGTGGVVSPTRGGSPAPK